MTVAPAADAPEGLVDVHVHLGASDARSAADRAYYPTLAAAEQLEVAREAGVARSCIFPPLQEAGYAAANAAVLAAGRASGAEALPFARLGGPGAAFCQRVPALWQVRRAARRKVLGAPDNFTAGLGGDGGLAAFSGVKLLPQLDGLPDEETFALIRSLALPVVVHGGESTPPAWVERRLLPRLRGCPVVLAHLGMFPMAEALLDDALALVRRHPGVVLDTSGIWSVAAVAAAVRAAPDQVVFASDAPLTHPAVAWAHVASAVRDDDALVRVGVTNPARVLAGSS